ncbi:amino acid-binding protein [Bacillus sp. V3-13]|nr:amino acid-binding protein [Bacillus sp. V3-13]
MFVSACSNSAIKTGSSSATEESDTIKIGMTSAITGPYSEYGEGNKRGVELAIDKWNKDGGINGKKIELEALDDQLVPDKSAVNMQKLLEDEEIVAVIGPAGSGPALATVPITEAKGMVHINPVAQTTDVTYPNGTDKPPRKNVFSFALQNDVEAKVLGAFVGEKWKKIGLIHESTAYGKSGMELIEKILKEEYGTEPVAKEVYNQKAADMTAQLAKIKNAGAEVILCIGLGADLANIRKGMNRLNIDIPLVATNGALSLPYKEGAGDLVEGTIGSMIGALGQEPLSPEAKEFADAYKAKYGVDRWWGDNEEKPQLFMSLSVVNAYDGANVLFEAIKNADSTKPEDIIKSLESIEDFKGTNSTYFFNKDKHHAISEDGVGLFQYVKEGNEIKLVPYQ